MKKSTGGRRKLPPQKLDKSLRRARSTSRTKRSLDRHEWLTGPPPVALERWVVANVNFAAHKIFADLRAPGGLHLGKLSHCSINPKRWSEKVAILAYATTFERGMAISLEALVRRSIVDERSWATAISGECDDEYFDLIQSWVSEFSRVTRILEREARKRPAPQKQGRT